MCQLMDKKKQLFNKQKSDTDTPLTILAFEQLLGHYKKLVWERKIAPTLISSNSLSKLYADNF